MTPHVAKDHPVKVDALTRVMFALTAAAVFGIGAIMWMLLNPTPERVVLDNTVPQDVTNTVTGVPGPAVIAGDGVVNVLATKCNLTDTPLDVRGDIIWQSVDPRGFTLVTGQGVSQRAVGCTDFAFANPIPSAVVEHTQTLVDKGRAFVVWQIVGTERPQCDNCADEDWWSEPFRVYVEAPT
jgi:hypothetical protein